MPDVILPSSLDYMDVLDYDKEGYSDCDNGSGCDAYSCRCYSIESVEIINPTGLDLWRAYANAVRIAEHNHDPILSKAQKLALRAAFQTQTITEDHLEAEWGRGYYGDELYCIKLDGQPKDLLDQLVERIWSSTDNECIALVLELKHGQSFWMEQLDFANGSTEPVQCDSSYQQRAIQQHLFPTSKKSCL